MRMVTTSAVVCGLALCGGAFAVAAAARANDALQGDPRLAARDPSPPTRPIENPKKSIETMPLREAVAPVDEAKDAAKPAETAPARTPSSPSRETKETKKAPGAVDPHQKTMDRLGQMVPSAQQAWLRQLEERATRAVRLTFGAEEAVRQQALVRAQLHRTTVTWRMLRDLVKSTDQREKKAIDRLVRRYRALVYDNFHKQTDQYEQRQQAWLDLYAAWREAGSQFEQQGRLIDWLEAAIRCATPGSVGPVPEKLEFQPETPPETATAQPAKEEKTPDSAEPETDDKAPGSDKPKSDAEPSPTKAAPKSPADETKPSPPPKPKNAEQPKADVEPSPTKAAPKPATKAAPTPAAKRTKPEEPAKPQSPQIPKASAKTDQTAARMEPPNVASGPTNAGELVKMLSSRRSASPQRSPSEPASPAAVKTDDDVASRIGSYNVAFRALEKELDAKVDWTAARLEPLQERLKALLARRHDLQSLREAFSAEQRTSLGQLAPSEGAISQFAALVAAARARVSGRDFKGSDAERRAELKRLEELSRRVAELTAKQ